MTSTVAHIGVGFLLSFVGSLPPGLINMSVAEATVSRGKRAAFLIALGAAFIEGLQVILAIKCASWFVTYPSVEAVIHIAAVPVFLGLGGYHLLKKGGKLSERESPPRSQEFFRGILLSSLNFLAIPFWLFYGSLLGTEGWLLNDVLIFVFTVGAFLGTLALLFAYGWMSLKIVNHLDQAEQITNQVLAILFIILGFWQLWRIVVV